MFQGSPKLHIISEMPQAFFPDKLPINASALPMMVLSQF